MLLMKLEDIKKSLEHAAEVELQRAVYNACGILDRDSVEGIFTDTIRDIYDS